MASPVAVLKFLLLFLKATVENFHTEPLFLERLSEQIIINITKNDILYYLNFSIFLQFFLSF